MNVFLYCFVEIMHMRYSTKPRRVDESLGWFTLIINTSLCPSAVASKYPNTFLTPICTILIQTLCTFFLVYDYLIWCNVHYFRSTTPGQCGRGSCLQMYRHYWMLVWDDDLSHFPPVKFIPVEIPSHCECVNVGKGQKT